MPVAEHLPRYRPTTLRRDLVAGLTVAALALPAGMAYAELAGLSPVAGLYALLLLTVAYALLGSSRQIIVGPEGSIAALAAIAPGVLVNRLDDRLVFANASYVRGRIREAPDGAPAPVRWLVFDAEALTHIDASGAEALTELVRSLAAEDVTFVLARLKSAMQQRLRAAGLIALVGENRVYPTVRAAVEAASTNSPTRGVTREG